MNKHEYHLKLNETESKARNEIRMMENRVALINRSESDIKEAFGKLVEMGKWKATFDTYLSSIDMNTVVNATCDHYAVFNNTILQSMRLDRIILEGKIHWRQHGLQLFLTLCRNILDNKAFFVTGRYDEVMSLLLMKEENEYSAQLKSMMISYIGEDMFSDLCSNVNEACIFINDGGGIIVDRVKFSYSETFLRRWEKTRIGENHQTCYYFKPTQ